MWFVFWCKLHCSFIDHTCIAADLTRKSLWVTYTLPILAFSMNMYGHLQQTEIAPHVDATFGMMHVFTCSCTLPHVHGWMIILGSSWHDITDSMSWFCYCPRVSWLGDLADLQLAQSTYISSVSVREKTRLMNGLRTLTKRTQTCVNFTLKQCNVIPCKAKP